MTDLDPEKLAQQTLMLDLSAKALEHLREMARKGLATDSRSTVADVLAKEIHTEFGSMMRTALVVQAVLESVQPLQRGPLLPAVDTGL